MPPELGRDAFQVVFHPAMRERLWAWAASHGYEIAPFPAEAADYPPGRLRTYIAVAGPALLPDKRARVHRQCIWEDPVEGDRCPRHEVDGLYCFVHQGAR